MDKILKNKILVVEGPTATGKSDLAVLLAKKFNGEVISADSRQVYSGMDIGTGKVTRREMGGVPHHLLDVATPKKIFTVADYQRLANEAIKSVIVQGKLPIICGGTGLYIRSIADGLVLPEVPPDKKLRRVLAKRSAEDLYKELKSLDPRRAKEIDRHNPARLIRAIEIARTVGAVPKLSFKENKNYEFLHIGLTLDGEGLGEKIHKRLLKRIKQGMVAEVEGLKASGVSWKRLESFGLEYRFVAGYLQGKMEKEEMIGKLEVAIRQYAKRQMTWFKKDKRIRWFNPADMEAIEVIVRKFLD